MMNEYHFVGRHTAEKEVGDDTHGPDVNRLAVTSYIHVSP